MQISPVIEGSPEVRDISSFAGIEPRPGMYMVLLVLFQRERSVGLKMWLWQPVFGAHQENWPSHPALDQTQTVFPEHWDV